MTTPDATVDRYAADREELLGRLGAHDTTLKVAGKKHDRLARLVTDLGSRVEQDHDGIVDLKARLTAVADKIDQGSPLKLVLATNGFTGDEIKSILKLQEDEQLTDATLLGGIVNQLGLLAHRTEALTSAIHDTNVKFNEEIGTPEAPGTLRAALTELNAAVAEVIPTTTHSVRRLDQHDVMHEETAERIDLVARQAQDGINNAGKPPTSNIIVAVGFAVIAFVVSQYQDVDTLPSVGIAGMVGFGVLILLNQFRRGGGAEISSDYVVTRQQPLPRVQPRQANNPPAAPVPANPDQPTVPVAVQV